ncbi:MAG: glycosyltransferase family 9 protein [Prevotellaceae bacterium]|nr:glycosyltransferase family 9 protein [Prevotella sp.]MDD7256736.1 glycosyltransferase family 9 protein [Prevotellaceae bacterium]MDY6130772.1 glycosyltransferase family 9 protein [Prevotella sp.]
MRTEHILIIRFSALGDIAMTVPVVYSLTRHYPDLRITVLSREFARPLFEDLGPNVGFMGADVKNEYQGIKGLNALYRRLAAKNFTAIADLHNVLRSEYLRVRFNLGRYKVAHIDKHRSGRRALVRAGRKVLVQQPTAFQNYAEVFAKLGYPVTLDFHSIFPASGGDLSLLPQAIGEKKEGEKWIGIAPFAAHERKIYPRRLMEEVLRQIKQQYPQCRLFFFGGGKKELETFTGWAEKYSDSCNASQLLGGIKEELILMSHLDAMLSMDSGNMHLASLTGIPVVSIWGATHPFAGFMGWGQSKDDAIQLELSCRPCSIFGNKPCLRGDLACLKNIPPELVVKQIKLAMNRRELLQKRKGNH